MIDDSDRSECDPTARGEKAQEGGRRLSPTARLLIGIVEFYRRGISPLLGANCRYQPTCSRYMIESVRKYGAIRGGIRGVRRILRCHPFRSGGYDPP